MLNLNRDVLIRPGYRQKPQILPLSYKVLGQQPSNFQAFDDSPSDRLSTNAFISIYLLMCVIYVN